MARLQKSSRQHGALQWGFFLLALALVVWVEWQRPAFANRSDESLRDIFVRLGADPRPEDRLVVVDIHEAALEELGPWPWPRARIADMVEQLLGAYRARAVALDIVFSEPADADGDQRLAALAAHGPLTLAQIFDYSPRDPPLAQGELTGGTVSGPLQSPPTGPPAYGYIANHAGLAKARCVGNIGYQPDEDGVLRKLPEQTLFGQRSYPGFAGAIVGCQGAGAKAAPSASALWRVPYQRTLSAYTVISAADVLRGAVPAELIADRYVLVGSSSLSLGDRVSTPLSPLSAGVMVHAASLSGLLDRAEGRTALPSSGRPWLLLWSVLTLALALVGISHLPAWGGMLLLLGLATGWAAAAFAGVMQQLEWSVTAPLWAYLFLLATAVPYEAWRIQHKARRLMQTFSFYVAKPVLDEIVRQDLQHSLEPTLRDVTVLIADMEGYTRATSNLALEDAAALTKDFLACLTRPVLAGGGTLDKYTGDGLVAFWGAPLLCADQADRAVSAALEALKEVEALNTRRAAEGFAPVRVRIGIESGRALVGDLGTPFRSTYTAVGDCINFASRLESAARDLSTSLVIGPTTNRQLARHPTRSLGMISIRGTHNSIEVFTVLSPQQGV